MEELYEMTRSDVVAAFTTWFENDETSDNLEGREAYEMADFFLQVIEDIRA